MLANLNMSLGLSLCFTKTKLKNSQTPWGDLHLPYTKMLKGRLNSFYDRQTKFTQQGPAQCN